MASEITGNIDLIVGDDSAELGVVRLTATNSYTGETQIKSNGTLIISRDANLGSDNGLIRLFGNASLATRSTLTLDRNLVIHGGGTRGFAGGLDVLSGTTLSYRGNITGSGSLRKTGGGTLALSAISTYTGGTVVWGGRLEVNRDVALGTPRPIPLSRASVPGISCCWMAH